MRIKFYITFLFLAAWCALSFGESVHLAWEAPDDDRITGYEIHYGDASGVYTEVEQAPGNTTEEAIFDVPTGLLYFAVRAKAENLDLYSEFSNEVSGTFSEYGLPVDVAEWHVSYEQDEEPEVATVTRTVAASGGDHTTIAAALAWFVSNHDFDTDGIARIQIIDTTSYTISSGLTLNGIPGTPSITAHLEITTDAGNPFDGPTINMTHTSSGGFYLDQGFIFIHGLLFHLNNTSSSTEVMRFSGNAGNFLISRNVFIALQQTSDQDGLYAANVDLVGSIDNNIFIGFARAAIHPQIWGGSNTQTWNIDHNSIADYHISGEVEGGGISISRVSLGVYSMNVYNNLVYTHSGNTNSSNYNEFGTGGTATWTGSNNIVEDTSAEGRFTSSYDSVTFIESASSSGENAWLTEINNTDETLIDLSIAGENAYTITGNGVSRVGSEPDARQDFSIDIMGNARDGTTPDIGAFEYVPESTAASFIPPQMQKFFAHLLVR